MRIYNRCVHKYLNELTREYRAHIFDRIQYATVPITSELVQCGQRPIPHYVLMMKHPADHAAEQRKGIVFFGSTYRSFCDQLSPSYVRKIGRQSVCTLFNFFHKS